MARKILVLLGVSAGLAACRGAGPDDLVQVIGETRPATTEWIIAPKGTVCEAPPAGPGHVVFRIGKKVFRIEARSGAEPEDVSAELDRFSRGADKFINTSPNGEWLLVVTSRFGCKANDCLAIVSKSVCAAQVVMSTGASLVVSGEGAAVSNDGAFVVYPGTDGPHRRDLWITRRLGSNDFTKPKLLTAASPGAFNQQPTLSQDGKRVLFECGPHATSAEGGSSICEVDVDGNGLRTVVTPDRGPWGTRGAIHHPDYAPDGSIAFESTWDGSAEQIWTVGPEATGSTGTRTNDDIEARAPAPATRICPGRSFTNDNSPCVLPDGRVVSLWLGRKGSAGHELKIMSSDCSSMEMLLSGYDVEDVGLGCSP